MKFSNLSLADGTLDAVAAMGYEETTTVQEQAIVPLLEGKDVVAQARTGTGKTGAFGIPMIDALRDNRDNAVLGLVLTPTRELAIQVAKVLIDIAQGSRLRIVTVYGGASYNPQRTALGRKGPKIVVATPGRLLDLIQGGDLTLKHVEQLVLDEADRMLDMGFVHDMRRISKMITRRQTGLFSATLPPAVKDLIQEFTIRPVTIRVESGEATIPQAEQVLIQVEKADKSRRLMHVLQHEKPKRAVVFTRTKHLAKRLATTLDKKGWSAVALQGNMTQGQRERAMEAFRAGQARILVATDVAARGLDVPGITHVVNFDMPDPETYVHRVGRTARNGAGGRAITFVQGDQRRDLKDVERFAGRKLDLVDMGPLGDNFPQGPDPTRTPTQPRGPRPNGGPKPRFQKNGGPRRDYTRRRNGPKRNNGGPRGNGATRTSPSGGNANGAGRSRNRRLGPR